MQEQIIGSYKVTGMIGEGGMGAVFKGIDLMLEREVAIKSLRPEYARQPGIVERFRKEAQTLARLNHPNIVSVYNFVHEDDRFFMVMEFVYGETLAKMIARKRVIPWKEAVPLFCQALRGIGHAHSYGIIHRDIKPANMIITQSGLLKVMDFGIARVLKTSRMTRTGHLLGTLEYMSPEQITGRDVDARSDIYSLGIVLYEMLAGRVPFTTGSDYETLRAQVEEVPRPMRQLVSEVPPELEALIAQALAKRPEQRLQTVDEFKERLENLLGVTRSETIPGLQPVPSPAPNRSSTVASKQPFTKFLLLLLIALTSLLLVQILPVEKISFSLFSEWMKSYWLWLIIISFLLAVGSIKSEWIGELLHKTSKINADIDEPVKGGGKEKYNSSIIQDNFSTVHSPTEPEIKPPPPSLIMKRPEYLFSGHTADQQIIEDLILHEDLERLESFIASIRGGRILLTGYGSFGGTSLIKGAIKRARKGLSEKGFHEGTLLAFYYNVIESNETEGKFEIKANNLSFGTFTSTYVFSSTRLLNTSLLKESGLSSWFSKNKKTQEFNFKKFIEGMNSFFTEDHNSEVLQQIILELISSSELDSRIIIIFDRIGYLTTLERLAQLDLFQNDKITVIALARKEDYDRWLDRERRIEKIGFCKWYIPCLRKNRMDYMGQIKETLFEPAGMEEAEYQRQVEILLRHLEFCGKGMLGSVFKELKHPQYWSSERSGNPYLRIDALPHADNIKHNAWLQEVLDTNWPTILGNLFAGREMDEKEDQAHIGVYHVIDWIADRRIFTFEELLEAARARPITISDSPFVLEEVVSNLLYVLWKLKYLKSNNNRYRLSWSKDSPPKIRKIGNRKVNTTVNGSLNQAQSVEKSAHSNKKLTLFFSYSHKDRTFRDALETHLAALKHDGVIETWHDGSIPAGTEWNKEILAQLDRANIIVLLISPDFLASKFCYEREMKRALQRHASSEAVVVPVIIRPADWEASPFSKLQALPKNAKPVLNWQNSDEAWTDVAKGIRKLVEDFTKQNLDG